MRIIDEHIEYMTPTVDLLKKWFDEFNERFFGRNLDAIPIFLTLLEDGTMAVFRFRKRKHELAH